MAGTVNKGNLEVERALTVTLRGEMTLRELLDALQGHTMPLESIVSPEIRVMPQRHDGMPNYQVRLIVRSSE